MVTQVLPISSSMSALVVVVVINGSYSAAPYSSPDQKSKSNIVKAHRKKVSFDFVLERANSV